MSEEIVFGIHAVGALIKHEPQSVVALYVEPNRRDGRLQRLLDQAAAANIAAKGMEREQLQQLCGGGRHQGVAAKVKAGAAALDEGALLALVEASERPLVLVLDGVQDPHNLGACLRSADAAGATAVVIPQDRSVGLNATVRKVASGAAETLPVVQVTNLVRSLEALKQRGIWTVGLADGAEQSLYAIDLTTPIALVLGAEEKGLRRLTKEACDFLAAIPMAGSVESLNVSVAAGVALFETVRQRSAR